jgi:hypothetical protein
MRWSAGLFDFHIRQIVTLNMDETIESAFKHIHLQIFDTSQATSFDELKRTDALHHEDNTNNLKLRNGSAKLGKSNQKMIKSPKYAADLMIARADRMRLLRETKHQEARLLRGTSQYVFLGDIAISEFPIVYSDSQSALTRIRNIFD